MSAYRIGGEDSDPRYLFLFLVGVVFGSVIRLVAFLVPSGLVRKLERLLLPSP